MSDRWNALESSPHNRSPVNLFPDIKYVAALAALGLTTEDSTPEYKLYQQLKAQGKKWDAGAELWVEREPSKREKAEQLLKSLGYRWDADSKQWELNESLQST